MTAMDKREKLGGINWVLLLWDMPVWFWAAWGEHQSDEQELMLVHNTVLKLWLKDIYSSNETESMDRSGESF